MFYAQALLTKKGAFGTLWLAAWERDRKLTRDVVFRTNLLDSIDKVSQVTVEAQTGNDSHRNQRAFSLRIQSYLLYGVVRIYRRKVEYLEKDANEALNKLSLGGALTDGHEVPLAKTAPMHTITLAEAAPMPWLSAAAGQFDLADVAMAEPGDFAVPVLVDGNADPVTPSKAGVALLPAFATGSAAASERLPEPEVGRGATDADFLGPAFGEEDGAFADNDGWQAFEPEVGRGVEPEMPMLPDDDLAPVAPGLMTPSKPVGGAEDLAGAETPILLPADEEAAPAVVLEPMTPVAAAARVSMAAFATPGSVRQPTRPRARRKRKLLDTETMLTGEEMRKRLRDAQGLMRPVRLASGTFAVAAQPVPTRIDVLLGAPAITDLAPRAVRLIKRHLPSLQQRVAKRARLAEPRAASPATDQAAAEDDLPAFEDVPPVLGHEDDLPVPTPGDDEQEPLPPLSPPHDDDDPAVAADDDALALSAQHVPVDTDVIADDGDSLSAEARAEALWDVLSSQHAGQTVGFDAVLKDRLPSGRVSRTNAAQCFYDLLVLQKSRRVAVQQPQPGAALSIHVVPE